MPATLLRIAGKFCPPTVAVLYEDRRGVRKLYEMPLPEAAADLTAGEIAAELALAHPSVFAALTIPEDKLLAAIDRVMDGLERKQLEDIEAAQRELAERLASVTDRLSCSEPDLDADDMLLPDPLSDEGEDLLRKSVSSISSRSSRGSRGSGGRYGHASAIEAWERVDASAESAFEWARCLDEPAE
jgi:hypothetical protein